jgi:hypothetical protein
MKPPPPSPWITRAAMRSQMLGAIAAITEPTMYRTRHAMNVRRRPRTSLIFPTTGRLAVRVS